MFLVWSFCPFSFSFLIDEEEWRNIWRWGGQAGFVFLPVNSNFGLIFPPAQNTNAFFLNCCEMFWGFFSFMVEHQLSKLVELWSLFFTKSRYIIYKDIIASSLAWSVRKVFVMWLCMLAHMEAVGCALCFVFCLAQDFSLYTCTVAVPNNN